MFKRREFLKVAGQTTAVLLARPLLRAQDAGAENPPFHFASDHIQVELSRSAPELLSINIDGLGQALRGANILSANRNEGGYQASPTTSGETLRVEYRTATAAKDTPAGWTFEFSAGKMVLTTEWSADFAPACMVLHFNLNQVHSTALGLFSHDGLLAMPALLHFPGQGSMRLTSSVPEIGLTYSSDRPRQSAMLSLPGADFVHKRIVYTFDVTAIHPDVPGIAGDPRFDAFRRNWLNALQLNPELQALANNTASDSCAFCYYEFADIAALTPVLARGLTALDVVRQTLDRMLAGGFAYGMSVVPDHPTVSSDTWPSMIIAAANCVRAGQSNEWLTQSYAGIRGWAESMLATDSSGDGLIKYAVSGNSGIWSGGTPKVRPANWWDTIGFGYEDAYANALAYRALGDMVVLAHKAGKAADTARYLAAADKLRAHYCDRFFDPATGILAGWRSADGELHDYYFLFVNGIAIHYGLVAKPQANAIMDKLMAKMKAVGYDKFNMGLPGNLITVTLKDYVHKSPDGHIGGGVLADNSDGFQNYENGGATGSFAFFTLAALYDLGRKEEADAILFPMLEEYGKSGFEGRDAKGRSPDWRRWDGTATGYEGYLTDNYYALLAVPLRQAEKQWSNGFRPAAQSGSGARS
jgi:hypothetical protein